MLELTMTTGMELQIGDDVKIVFRGGSVPGRMKIGVEAPKDKRIERVKSQEKRQGAGVIIVRNTDSKCTNMRNVL